jgi:hypothetical protein
VPSGMTSSPSHVGFIIRTRSIDVVCHGGSHVVGLTHHVECPDLGGFTMASDCMAVQAALSALVSRGASFDELILKTVPRSLHSAAAGLQALARWSRFRMSQSDPQIPQPGRRAFFPGLLS